MWSCCTDGGLISRFKIIIFHQIHTHSRPIPSSPPSEDLQPSRDCPPSEYRPPPEKSSAPPKDRPTSEDRPSSGERLPLEEHPQQWETKTWSWRPLRQPRVSHGPKLGPWETTMPDRDRLRGSIVSHLNHTPPTKRKSHRQRQKIPSAPLAAGKSCCRGRRRASAPLVVMVFVVRWTRWDFRGCTWYTECGSEGLLGLGQWTWYRPSKWTWSTKGCQSNGNGRVKNVNPKSHNMGIFLALIVP